MATTGFMDAFQDSSSENLLSIARICEQAERYEDMCAAMSALVKRKCGEDTDLDTEERNLLSVAYKNVVGSKRASWRTLAATEDGDESELVTKYRGFIETELENQCLEVLALLEQNLVPRVKGRSDETEVFYLKMCGDYYRYLAEFRTTNQEYADKSVEHYGAAMEIASNTLEPTHPTRLGLALNLSVCYYEIQKNQEKACELAKQAFDEAIAKLDGINDQTYKDSTLIMQLLRDNLTLWTSSNDDGGDE